MYSTTVRIASRRLAGTAVTWALPAWALALIAGCQWVWPGTILSPRASTPGGGVGSAAASPEPAATPFEYFRIVRAGTMDLDKPITGMPGDTVKLAVIRTFPDGVRLALPASASVSWGGPPVLTARDSLDRTPLATGATLLSLATWPDPTEGAAGEDTGDSVPPPGATWVRNPDRSDHRSDLEGLLFLQDTSRDGTAPVEISCRITGPFPPATASTTVSIRPGPAGDSGRGQALYEALCASCHGQRGKGSPATPDHRAYAMGHYRSLFPAPSLVGESAPGSGALLALMVMGDLAQNGRSLRSPMPNWLGIPNPDTGELMGAADFADLAAYLRTLP